MIFCYCFVRSLNPKNRFGRYLICFFPLWLECHFIHEKKNSTFLWFFIDTLETQRAGTDTENNHMNTNTTFNLSVLFFFIIRFDSSLKSEPLYGISISNKFNDYLVCSIQYALLYSLLFWFLSTANKVTKFSKKMDSNAMSENMHELQTNCWSIYIVLHK